MAAKQLTKTQQKNNIGDEGQFVEGGSSEDNENNFEEESEENGNISDVEELSDDEEDDVVDDDDDEDDDGTFDEEGVTSTDSEENEEDSDANSDQPVMKTETVLEADDGSTTEEITTNTSTQNSDLEDDAKDLVDNTNKKPEKYLVLQDYINENSEYLNLKKGEVITILDKIHENWWRAENYSSEKGLVPSNLLTQIDDQNLTVKDSNLLQGHRRGSLLWKNLKKLIHQHSANKNSASVSHSKWLPSTLNEIKQIDDRYSTQCVLMPKLKKSGLGFQEIFYENEGNPVRVPSSSIQKCMNLISAQNIPLHELRGVSILHPHLYVCLFDGSNILSNIHSVHAKWDNKTPKMWNFCKNISLNSSCAEEGKLFIKSDYISTHIGILIEFCATVKNMENDEGYIITCGWSFLKLFDEVGHPIKNGTFTLPVNKGSFYEQEQHPLENTTQNDESKSFLFTQNRLPRLTIKLMHPKGPYKMSYEYLPHSLIGPVSLLPFFILYQQILFDSLLLSTSSSAKTIHCPALSIFARCSDFPDFMDVLRIEWSEALKRYHQSEKKKPELMKKVFTSAVMYSLNSLCNINFPEYSLTNPQTIMIRKQFLDHLQEIKLSKGHLSKMLSPNFQYNGFDVMNVGFESMGFHCLHIFDSALT